MAARRPGGSGKGAIYTAVFFAFTTITAIVLAVLAYGDLDKQRKERDQALQDLSEFAKDSERGNPDISRLVQEANKLNNKSVTTHLIDQLKDVKRLITGDTSASPAEIKKQMSQYVPEGQTALAALTALRDKSDVLQTNIQGLNEEISSNKKDLQSLRAQYEAMKVEREQKVKALQETIDKLSADIEMHRKSTDRTQAEANQKYEEAQAKAAEQLLASQNQAKALRTEVTRLELRIKELKRLIAVTTPNPETLIDQIDGHILSVNPDQNLVYINLGRKDHLSLGMTFEVFDQTRGIEVKRDSAGKLVLERGKATIEVMELEADSAVCRVVRSLRSQTILAKDLVANLVYDRRRQFKFFVFGQFDIDGDGTHTLADFNLIKELVRKWGGKVATLEDRQEKIEALLGKAKAADMSIPLDTDFIVIGMEPEPPAPLTEEEKNQPEVVAEWLRKQKLWQQFSQLQDQAKILSVPIINQHRFLDLVGYYR